MVGSVFALPVGSVPPELAEYSPDGARPLIVAGHVMATVAYVRYEPGSVLTYDELLVAVLGRWGRQPAATLPHIWVDSEDSLAGGRGLWNIPKGLARFERDGDGAAVSIDGAPVATLHASVGARLLPGWQAFSLTTAQRLEGTSVVAANGVRAHLRRLSARWEFDPAGPLAYLRGARRLSSVALADMGISFGVSCTRW